MQNYYSSKRLGQNYISLFIAVNINLTDEIFLSAKISLIHRKTQNFIIKKLTDAANNSAVPVFLRDT